MHDLNPWQVRGATKEIAARLGISSAAVSQWRTAASGIPEKHREVVRAVIKEILARPNPPPHRSDAA